MRKTLLQRFEEKVYPEPNTGCWIWAGYSNKKGYGAIGHYPKVKSAHRVSFELFNGKIPNNQCVCHSCDNTFCVNPDHLFLGSNAQNANDRLIKFRYGKKLTSENILEIRLLYKSGVKQKHIAPIYGVSKGYISTIILKKVWKQI